MSSGLRMPCFNYKYYPHHISWSNQVIIFILHMPSNVIMSRKSKLCQRFVTYYHIQVFLAVSRIARFEVIFCSGNQSLSSTKVPASAVCKFGCLCSFHFCVSLNMLFSHIVIAIHYVIKNLLPDSDFHRCQRCSHALHS